MRLHKSNKQSGDLRFILEHLQAPAELNEHPWTKSLVVQDMLKRYPVLVDKPAGLRLISALAELFQQMMPATPPQEGKRLDTRWGRFGILAANYFAPLVFGRHYPHSLVEAWRGIDQAILLFVYHDVPMTQLKPEQIKLYQLIGDGVAYPANSTISDWHRQALGDLSDLFFARERALNTTSGQASPLLEAPVEKPPAKDLAKRTADGRRPNGVLHWAELAILAGTLLACVLVVARGFAVYQRLEVVKGDVASLQGVPLASMQPEALQQAAQLLERTDRDIAALRTEAAPLLWLAPRLGWVPVYGADLRFAPDLLEAASDFTAAAHQSLVAIAPTWGALHQAGDVKASDLSGMLLNMRPTLLEAQATLQRAKAARQRVPADRLSPESRQLVEHLDPYLSLLDESLSLGLTIPELLGGTDSGPKTYLILIENEDELRPTGGFITAVGKIVVWKGQLVSLTISDSYSVDDIQKAYPAAPWQMQEYMNIPIMVFRDASWYTDYPTAVRWAEYLYAYTNAFSVDGVIAIDQHVMTALLSVTGPVYVPEINTTVTSDNLRVVMRAQKVPPPPQQRDPDWHRKQFLNPIASAILGRFLTGQGISWEQLLKVMLGELDQRHVLVELDNPVLAPLLAARGWDGAVRREAGDFLMVVDTNVGYNKTNAVVSSTIAYDVNLTDLTAPSSNLVVFHTNKAEGPDELCDQRPPQASNADSEHWYPIDRCYYDYLRVYLPAGAQYTSGTPHPVSVREMLMLQQDVPARVDFLDEGIANVQGFGTLLIVPMGQSTQTGFEFRLPVGILQMGPSGNDLIYHLRVEKQAGTQAVPLTLRVHLPASAQIEAANQPFAESGPNLLFDLDLKTDLEIQIQFRP